MDADFWFLDFDLWLFYAVIPYDKYSGFTKKTLSTRWADRVCAVYSTVWSSYKTEGLPAASGAKRQNHKSSAPSTAHAARRDIFVLKTCQISGRLTATFSRRRIFGAGRIWGSCTFPAPVPISSGYMPRFRRMPRLRHIHNGQSLVRMLPRIWSFPSRCRRRNR